MTHTTPAPNTTIVPATTLVSGVSIATSFVQGPPVLVEPALSVYSQVNGSRARRRFDHVEEATMSSPYPAAARSGAPWYPYPVKTNPATSFGYADLLRTYLRPQWRSVL